jgi:8-oxo-dGTP diphosphatase
MEDLRVKVGVGVLVFKDDKILFMRRKNAHGEGEFGGPGGHFEFGETLEECAARETMEEAGIEIQNPQVIALSNLVWEGKQYIDIGMRADWKSGEARICEPEKCSELVWKSIDEVPERLFGATKQYIEAVKTGKLYFGTIDYR